MAEAVPKELKRPIMGVSFSSTYFIDSFLVQVIHLSWSGFFICVCLHINECQFFYDLAFHSVTSSFQYLALAGAYTRILPRWKREGKAGLK